MDFVPHSKWSNFHKDTFGSCFEIFLLVDHTWTLAFHMALEKKMCTDWLGWLFMHQTYQQHCNFDFQQLWKNVNPWQHISHSEAKLALVIVLDALMECCSGQRNHILPIVRRLVLTVQSIIVEEKENMG